MIDLDQRDRDLDMLVALYRGHTLPPDEDDFMWLGRVGDFLERNRAIYFGAVGAPDVSAAGASSALAELVESNVHFIGGGAEAAFVLIRQVEDPAPDLGLSR